MSRWLPWMGGLLALSATWNWPPPRTAPTPLVVGHAYATAASASPIEFDLPFDGRTRYVLIVENVARDVAPRTFHLAARAVAAQPVNARSVAAQSVVDPSLASWSALPSEGELSTRRPPAEPPPRLRRATRRAPAAPERAFSVMVTGAMSSAPASYRTVYARLAASGPTVDVYLDPSDSGHVDTPAAVVAAYETIVRPACERWLGAPPDVDDDGAVTVLLTSWLDRLEGGAVSLGGMVRPADYDPRGAWPRSNRGDVIYFSRELRPGRHLETLLAHELAHALVAAARQSQRGWFGADSEEGWLSEGLAHVSEHLATRGWSNLDARVDAYLARPAAAPLVVPDYAAVGLARDPGCRGATYLFTRWCVERFGAEVLPGLVTSSLSGEENLAAATGCDLETLTALFAVDLFEASTGGTNCLAERGSSGDAKSASDAPVSPFATSLALAKRTDRGAGAPLGAIDWALDRALDCANAAEHDCPIAGTARQYLTVSSREPGVWRVSVTPNGGTARVIVLPQRMAARPTT